MMRIVVDTNIIVSGYLGGALEAIIIAWKSGKFTLVVSAAIVDEYLSVIKRPKFQIEHQITLHNGFWTQKNADFR
jgi:predicted nucleic acid-binding protein